MFSGQPLDSSFAEQQLLSSRLKTVNAPLQFVDRTGLRNVALSQCHRRHTTQTAVSQQQQQQQQQQKQQYEC